MRGGHHGSVGRWCESSRATPSMPSEKAAAGGRLHDKKIIYITFLLFRMSTLHIHNIIVALKQLICCQLHRTCSWPYFPMPCGLCAQGTMVLHSCPWDGEDTGGITHNISYLILQLISDYITSVPPGIYHVITSSVRWKTMWRRDVWPAADESLYHGTTLRAWEEAATRSLSRRWVGLPGHRPCPSCGREGGWTVCRVKSQEVQAQFRGQSSGGGIAMVSPWPPGHSETNVTHRWLDECTRRRPSSPWPPLFDAAQKKKHVFQICVCDFKVALKKP